MFIGPISDRSSFYTRPSRGREKWRSSWPALQLAAQIASPTADDEERNNRKKWDFGMMALNSTRPVALQAVIRFAVLAESSNRRPRRNPRGTPHIFELLSSHLGPEPSTICWSPRNVPRMEFRRLAWAGPRMVPAPAAALFPESRTKY